MKKIKITEAQANLIKSITEGDAHESPLKINKGLRPSTQNTNTFKKETKGLGLKFENEIINEGITMELIQLAQEALEFVKVIYSDPSTKDISPFWQSLGMTAGEVKELLTDVGLMTMASVKGASYFGKKDIIGKLRKLYKKLRQLIYKKKGEGESEADNTFKTSVDEDESNLSPDVSDSDPQFNPPETERPDSSSESLFTVVWHNDDLVILKSHRGLYVYYHEGSEGIEDYVERTVIGYDQDGEGNHYPEYHEDYDVDEEAISNFINDNHEEIGIGHGIRAFDNGLITKLDNEVKNEVLAAWNEPELEQILNGLDETSLGGGDGGMGVFGGDGEGNNFPVAQFATKPEDYIDVQHQYSPSEQLGEMDSTTAGGDSGQIGFDVPMGDNSDFWTAGNKLNRRKISKGQLEEDAKTQTQWENGSFVKIKEKCKTFPYCDQGPDAIETKKTKTAVISDDVFETIANKTGRPVTEVKRIIGKYKKK